MTSVAIFPAPKLSAQIAELKRERKMRERVYPFWIQNKKIKQSTADYQMLCLDEAIRTLEGLANGEERGGTVVPPASGKRLPPASSSTTGGEGE